MPSAPETPGPVVTVPPPPLAVTSGQVFSRLFAQSMRFAKVLAPYVTVQLIVQLLGNAVGFIIIRAVSKHEFAIYTIATLIQGTLMVLADVGVSSALSGTGGKVWQDPYRFGQLVKTGLQMRTILSVGVLVISVPIMVWMFLKNGVPLAYTILIIIALAAGAGARLTSDILTIVPKIKGQVKRLQTFDLVGAVLRVGFIGVLYLTTLNALLAVLSATIAAYLQNIMLLKWVKGDITWDAPPNPEDKPVITAAIKKQFANTLYFCAQGQITITVISLFGKTSDIANIGALGKIAVIFTIIGSVLGNLVMPRFAREQSWRVLLRIYYLSLAGLTTVSLIVMGVVLLFPGPVLWILGPKYQDLQEKLPYSVLSAILMTFTGFIFGLNAARAWFGQVWITIPIMFVTQVLLAYSLDLTDISNVMLLTSLPYAISCIVPVYTFVVEINKMKMAPSPTDTH